MQRNVLIVDDEPNMLLVMRMALEEVGFAVHAAERVDDALAILPATELDVILTDLKMPGSSGIEFIRACQQQCEDVPIIVVTAYGSIRSAIECLQAGASNYLTKPFEPEALQFAVQNALRYRDLLHENRQLRVRIEAGEAAQGNGLVCDLAAVGELGLDTWLGDAERKLIVQALDACDGVQVNAARMLGISERSLWHRLKKLDIHVNKKVAK
jgi:DNA-binding NtrC family response regulator